MDITALVDDLPAGLLSGAFLGFIAKSALDAWKDRQDRQHDRRMRLTDTALTTAVTFMAAAEHTARRMRDFRAIEATLKGFAPDARSDENRDWARGNETMRKRWDLAQESSAEAETALAGLYLIVPSVGDPANRYLRLCREAVPGGDPQEAERRQVRVQVEGILQDKLDALD